MKDEVLKTAEKAVQIYTLYKKRLNARAGLMICDEEHFSGWKINSRLLEKNAGCFVSLSVNGVERGTMGSLYARTDCTAQEIVNAAISAASQDPAQEPVMENELKELKIKVFLLNPPEKTTVEQLKDLEEKAAGSNETDLFTVQVSKAYRQGICLPCGESLTLQLTKALEKGNISMDENPEITLYKTEVFSNS